MIDLTGLETKRDCLDRTEKTNLITNPLTSFSSTPTLLMIERGQSYFVLSLFMSIEWRYTCMLKS